MDWTETDLPRLKGSIDFAVGDWILGLYRVEALRSGAMGVVYLCSGTAGEHAIKTILADPLADEGARRQMEAEAQAWLGLGPHPNVVQCTYILRSPYDKRLFLFLERVHGHPERGTSLKEWMSRGPLDGATVTSIAIGMAQGMRFAGESAGLVHRDLKPDNVLMTADGTPKIGDFGLARPLAGDGTAPGLAGTPAYMAPETWLSGANASVRSDVYAFGVILWELLAGEHPFADHLDSGLHIRYAHASLAPSDPRTRNDQAPEVLARLALACLAKDPGERPTDFAAVLAALGQEAAAPSAKMPFSYSELNRAQGLMNLGRWSEAEAILEAARGEVAAATTIDLLRFRLLAGTGRVAEDQALVERVAASAEAGAIALDFKHRALVQLGRRVEALAALDQALAVESRWDLLHARGLLLWTMDRHEEALAAFEAADRWPALVDRARLLFSLRRDDEAITCLQRALALNPNDERALLSAAVALEQRGRREEALAFVEKARHVSPDFAPARRMHAHLLAALGRQADAEAALRELLEQEPDDVELWSDLLRVLAGQGRGAEMHECMARIAQGRAHTARGHLQKGGMVALLGNPHEAIESFDRAIVLDPVLALAWQWKGDALMNLGEAAKAVAAYRNAAALDPADESTAAHLSAAQALLEGQLLCASDPRQALAAFERGLARDPGSESLRIHRVLALVALDRHGAALPMLDALLQESPRRPELLVQRVRSLALLALNDEAAAHARSALAVLSPSPDRDNLIRVVELLEEPRERPPNRRHTIGWYWHQEATRELHAHRHEEAEERYRRALYADPDEAAHAAGLAACLMLLASGRPGALAEGVALFEDADRRRPDDPIILYNFAAALPKVGRAGEAMAIVRRLRRLTPDDPDLDRLEQDVRAALATD